MRLLHTISSCFYTNQANRLVRDEVIERSDRVTSSTNTCNNSIRELPASFLQLLSNLLTNDFLEVPHDSWEGMGTNSGSDEVMSGGKVGYPITECFVNSILEST